MSLKFLHTYLVYLEDLSFYDACYMYSIFRNTALNEYLTPNWSVLDFWKFNLKKSSSTFLKIQFEEIKFNEVDFLFISNWTFTACVAYKNHFRNWFLQKKIQFVDLDFSNLIFQNSITDQQGGLIFPREMISLSFYV